VDSLQATVVSSHLNNAQFKASLAVDIMDRNLYERANDCRWWALTSSFRKILSQDSISEDDKKQLTTILVSINNLYTVYTNLYLYDANANVLAVSNPQEGAIIGTNVADITGASAALLIKDAQKYSVSSFMPTSLYNNRHTYIYNASVTQLEKETVVGGIGIVFDSEPQFKAMLMDTLPLNENGEGLPGCFAFFTDRNKNIISAINCDDLSTGDSLELEDSYFSLENGKSSAAIVPFQGNTYVLGYATSNGYREYKTTGDYKNDVLAFIFIPF